jgi:hypothetical protein
LAVGAESFKVTWLFNDFSKTYLTHSNISKDLAFISLQTKTLVRNLEE